MTIDSTALVAAITAMNTQLRATCSLLAEVRGSVAMTHTVVQEFCESLLEAEILIDRLKAAKEGLDVSDPV